MRGGRATDEFRTDGGGIAGHVHLVLHADGNPVPEAEGAPGTPAFGARACLRDDVVAIDGDEGAQRSLAAWLDQRTTGPDESMPSYDELLDQVESSMLDSLLARFDGKPTRLAAALPGSARRSVSRRSRAAA